MTNKYGARKTTVDGITFDSLGEAKWYQELRVREKAGEIYGLRHHPRVQIYGEDGVLVCTVEGDAAWYEDKEKDCLFPPEHWGDFKGADNALSRLKRKLAKHFGGVNIELYGPAANKKRRATVKAKPKQGRSL